MVEESYSQADKAIGEAKERLADLSRRIWEKPELLYEEHFAHQTLTKFLEEEGFSVERHFVYKTGFRASFCTGSGPTVALIAEFDALPEIGHACGHNLIAEVAMGAAVGVKAAMLRQGIKGKVVVLGTPAEEGGGGKVGMIKEGAFDQVDCALMAHPAPWNKADCGGKDFSAGGRLHVTFTGRASHAAAGPWEGVNALDAAVMAYNSLSMARQQLHHGHKISMIITKGGVAENVIPDETRMLIAVRAPSTAEMLAVLAPKVEACLRSAATATGCEVDLRWESFHYDHLISNQSLVASYKKHAQELGVFESERSSMCAGTDMGNVSQLLPSLHPIFSIGGEVTCANHTRNFTQLAGSLGAQEYTLKQCRILARVAVDVMNHPEWIPRMKEELTATRQLEQEKAQNAIKAALLTQS